MQGYPYSERRNFFLCLHVAASSAREFNVLSLLAGLYYMNSYLYACIKKFILSEYG